VASAIRRSGAKSRSRLLAGGAGAWCLALALALGCAAPPTQPPARPVEIPERAFLLDPAASSGLPAEAPARRRLADEFARLIATGNPAPAAAAANQLLADQPEMAAARVLAAQAALVGGRAAEARALVEPVAAADAGNIAALLLLGRTAELAGDVPAAYGAYRAASAVPAAAAKATALQPAAVAAAAEAMRAALERGNQPQAESSLRRLREWAPDSAEALHGERAVAAAAGDPARELAAVRRLLRGQPQSPELLERQAILEVESGDAGAAVAILQRLAESQPRDTRLAGLLDWAKFQWRLDLLPPAVRRVADKPQLDRADLATLLYWLAPGVRRGRGSTGRIASDVLDHPQREEIVRVVNQGLMDVDETLHRFAPDQSAKRGDVLRALVAVIAEQRPGSPCLGAAGAPGGSRRLSLEVSCQAASACGLLPSPGDCLTAAPVTGAEAVEWIRLAAAVVGDS